MPFRINHDLLTQARAVLSSHNRLYWIVGGAGSGKTTICQILSARFQLPVYDMDAHIYGAYYARFTPERHPVNSAWAAAQDGLAWLLAMSWDEFDSFNQAALPEYLDLLAQDLGGSDSKLGLLIDGGICNPAILGQVIPARQIICLAAPGRLSADIWEATAERRAMKDEMNRLPDPEKAWRTFLEFDSRITRTILRECQENDITVCSRDATEPADEFAERVAQGLGIR